MEQVVQFFLTEEKIIKKDLVLFFVVKSSVKQI